MSDCLIPEYTVTVGTNWAYVGNGDAIRLKSVNHAAGVAVIEIASADRAFPDDEAAAAEIERRFLGDLGNWKPAGLRND